MQVTFMIQPMFKGSERVAEMQYDAWYARLAERLGVRIGGADRETDTLDDTGNVEWNDGELTSRVWLHVDHTKALQAAEALRESWDSNLFNVFVVLYHDTVPEAVRRQMIAVCPSFGAEIQRNEDGDEHWDNVEFVCYKQHQFEATVAALVTAAA